MKKLLISALLPRGLRFKTRGFNSSYLSAYGPVMTLLFPSPSQRYRQLVMNPNMLLWLHDAAGKVDHEGFAARLVKISNYYSPPLHIRGEYFLHYFRLQGSIQWKIYTPVRLLDALHVKLRGWKARNKLSKFTMVSVSILSARMLSSAWKSSIRRFVITEKAPTRAFSWLKATTTAFTFKTLLRHYAKRALTPRSLNVKLGRRRKSHKGWAVWLA